MKITIEALGTYEDVYPYIALGNGLRKDPGFGGLVRVRNKRIEFLWVHEKFASEY